MCPRGPPCLPLWAKCRPNRSPGEEEEEGDEEEESDFLSSSPSFCLASTSLPWATFFADTSSGGTACRGVVLRASTELAAVVAPLLIAYLSPAPRC